MKVRAKYRKRQDDGCVRQVYSFYLRPDTMARLDQWAKSFDLPNRASAVESILRRTLHDVILSVHEEIPSAG